MTSVPTYVALERLGPVLRTGEAAAALRTSVSSASRMLRGLEAHGLAHHVRSGVWFVGPDQPDPFVIAPELTRPHLAYVSFESALNFHAMIDQIPREITVASLDRARRIATSLGMFAIHHLPPALFGGWQETRRGHVAGPEKAIFDLCYAGAAHRGRTRRIPELELPAGFDSRLIEEWATRVESPRVGTLTRRAIDYAMSRAVPR
jgi:predicted transcriptional regulator of viral defense system